jgi:uncharacterized membrane protein YkgB
MPTEEEVKRQTNKKTDGKMNLNQIDARITEWLARNGIDILRIGLGIVFIWFGTLKFFPGLSPIEDLVARVIPIISFGMVSPAVGLPVLAALECVIGIGLITKHFLRITILLLFIQLLGAMSPLIVLPSVSWQYIPYVPTLVGQYIIKDIVLIAAGLVIGATVRGGKIVGGTN